MENIIKTNAVECVYDIHSKINPNEILIKCKSPNQDIDKWAQEQMLKQMDYMIYHKAEYKFNILMPNNKDKAIGCFIKQIDYDPKITAITFCVDHWTEVE